MKNLITALLFLSFYHGSVAQTEAEDLYTSIKKLPSFSVNKLPDSTAYTNKDLATDKPLILVFFNPDCEHCQKEAEELVAGKDSLKDFPILMLSFYSIKEINEFYEKYGLNVMENVTMAQDPFYRFGGIFQMRTFPAMYIYDKKRNLQKALSGHITIAAILATCNQLL